jgi:hypothetical protein
MAVDTFSLMSICIDSEFQDSTLNQREADNKGTHIRLLGKQTRGKNTEEESKISYNLPFTLEARNIFQITVESSEIVPSFNSKLAPGFKP